MKMPLTVGAVLAASILSGACKGEPAPEAQTPAAEAAPPSPGAMGSMSGMGGGATAMMDEMGGHLRDALAATADSAKAMLPMHRRMVANMLSQFGREMQEMNMKADARWDALADSVRADLTRMPELSAGDLRAMMAAHAGRVGRLMEMHRGMSAGMKM